MAAGGEDGAAASHEPPITPPQPCMNGVPAREGGVPDLMTDSDDGDLWRAPIAQLGDIYSLDPKCISAAALHWDVDNAFEDVLGNVAILTSGVLSCANEHQGPQLQVRLSQFVREVHVSRASLRQDASVYLWFVMHLGNACAHASTPCRAARVGPCDGSS
jgi:hypothetical protein